MSSAATSHALIERPVSFHCIANCRLVKRPGVKLLIKNRMARLYGLCVDEHADWKSEMRCQPSRMCERYSALARQRL